MRRNSTRRSAAREAPRQCDLSPAHGVAGVNLGWHGVKPQVTRKRLIDLERP
jgi:hypothetical protein